MRKNWIPEYGERVRIASFVPAHLREDHEYLVSCYGHSKKLIVMYADASELCFNNDDTDGVSGLFPTALFVPYN